MSQKQVAPIAASGPSLSDEVAQQRKRKCRTPTIKNIPQEQQCPEDKQDLASQQGQQLLNNKVEEKSDLSSQQGWQLLNNKDKVEENPDLSKQKKQFDYKKNYEQLIKEIEEGNKKAKKFIKVFNMINQGDSSGALQQIKDDQFKNMFPSPQRQLLCDEIKKTEKVDSSSNSKQWSSTIKNLCVFAVILILCTGVGGLIGAVGASSTAAAGAGYGFIAGALIDIVLGIGLWWEEIKRIFRRVCYYLFYPFKWLWNLFFGTKQT